jgi:hypothetical protein
MVSIPSFSEIVQKAKDTVGSMFKTTSGWFKSNVMDPITSKFKDGGQWFKDHITTPIASKFSTGGQWFKDKIMKPIQGTFAAGGTWFTEHISKPIQGFVDEKLPFLKTIREWFQNIGGKMIDFFKGLPDFFKRTITAFKDIMAKVKQWIKNAVDWFRDLPAKIRMFPHKVKDFFRRMWSGIWDWITKSKVAQWLKKNWKYFMVAGSGILGIVLTVYAWPYLRSVDNFNGMRRKRDRMKEKLRNMGKIARKKIDFSWAKKLITKIGTPFNRARSAIAARSG